MSDAAAIVRSARARLRADTHLDIDPLVRDEIGRAAPLLDAAAASALHRTVVAELVGLGPLEPLLADPAVTEVMVNAGREIWVDRAGSTERVGELAPGQLDGLLERIVAPLGLRLDRTRPIVDARLPDGSRVCAVVPPLAPDGPCCSIRRFRVRSRSIDDIVPTAISSVLNTLVAERANLVVSGATSSGKTTLLNALAAGIPPGERIVTIEDTAELRLAAAHVVRLEARPELGDGPAAVPVRALLRAALRLRPDRLVVGEVRGDEALDMVQALNTGHDGSMTTCHANSPLDALRRIEAMVSMAAPAWPSEIVREQVHASVDAVVHLTRGRDGQRSVTGIVEVARPEHLAIGARVTPILEDGRVVGSFTRGRS